MNFLEALSTSLVDIVNIRSKNKSTSFPEKDIDRLVNFILTSGALINPIIVKRLSEDNFEVVEGDLEYFAFVKASEINSDLEMIRAIIITSEQEALIKQQAIVLRNSGNTTPPPEVDLLLEFSSFKSQILREFQDFKRDIKSDLIKLFDKELNVIKSQLDEIISRLPKKKILESEKEISELEKEILQELNTLNDTSLQTKLKSISINKTVASTLIGERNKTKFDSLNDVVARVKGFGAASKSRILTTWNS